jgi:hypothetical protein
VRCPPQLLSFPVLNQGKEKIATARIDAVGTVRPRDPLASVDSERPQCSRTCLGGRTTSPQHFPPPRRRQELEAANPWVLGVADRASGSGGSARERLAVARSGGGKKGRRSGGGGETLGGVCHTRTQ